MGSYLKVSRLLYLLPHRNYYVNYLRWSVVCERRGWSVYEKECCCRGGAHWPRINCTSWRQSRTCVISQFFTELYHCVRSDYALLRNPRNASRPCTSSLARPTAEPVGEASESAGFFAVFFEILRRQLGNKFSCRWVFRQEIAVSPMSRLRISQSRVLRIRDKSTLPPRVSSFNHARVDISPT